MTSPKNQNAEVLFELIHNSTIDRKYILKTTGILNLTARISNLRNDYDIEVLCTRKKVLNKHGRKISYGLWSLKDKAKAIEIYEKVNHN